MQIQEYRYNIQLEYKLRPYIPIAKDQGLYGRFR